MIMWKKPEVIVGRMIERATVNIDSKDNVVEAQQIHTIESDLVTVDRCCDCFCFLFPSHAPHTPSSKVAVSTGCYGVLLHTISVY